MEGTLCNQWMQGGKQLLHRNGQEEEKFSHQHVEALYQGWPTSQMLGATFFSVFQQRAISYTTDNDVIKLTIPLIDTHVFA